MTPDTATHSAPRSASRSASRPAPPLPSPKERRRLREAMSMTEDQVAQHVGVTRATVRSWETGRTTPRGRKREAYARLLSAAREDAPADPRTPDAPVSTEPPTSPVSPVAPEPQEAGCPKAEAPEAPEAPETAGAPGAGAPGAAAAPAVPAVPAPADAFDALYTYAAPLLVQQAYLLTGRRRLSREAVEYAFHQAWQHWPRVAVDRDPAGWVRAAVHDYALSPWHRLRPSHRQPDEPPTDRAARALREALLELPPAYRRTLLLYDGLGLDLPETAAETEASTPAAGNRVLHARELLAARVPETADPAVLHRRLAALLDKGPTMVLATPRTVRGGSERRVRGWTRAAFGLTALVVGATAFTLATAPTAYHPPLAPGEAVEGVPVLSGPERLTPRGAALRDRLRDEPVTGPPRLVPDTH
ncbi:sigma factor-like helix-turn-helix DNA-binding protein [Streptomyces sp. NPDC015131]|uniref:sigma factor-like helix-turn-helix DNA-binding protein n=1 Tax=Streptomyces sp. NPDC015131 TaxID=3364941 RepID=UPI0036FB9E03